MHAQEILATAKDTNTVVRDLAVDHQRQGRKTEECIAELATERRDDFRVLQTQFQALKDSVDAYAARPLVTRCSPLLYIISGFLIMFAYTVLLRSFPSLQRLLL